MFFEEVIKIHAQLQSQFTFILIVKCHYNNIIKYLYSILYEGNQKLLMVAVV